MSERVNFGLFLSGSFHLLSCFFLLGSISYLIGSIKPFTFKFLSPNIMMLFPIKIATLGAEAYINSPLNLLSNKILTSFVMIGVF